MKIRILKPKVSDWFEIEGNNFGEVIQEHHYNDELQNNYSFYITPEESRLGRRETIYLREYENEQHEKLISRIFYTGIFRKGNPNLSDSTKQFNIVEKELGLTKEKILS